MTAPARVGGSSSRGRTSQSRRKAAAAAAATTEAPESTTEAPPRTERRPRTAAAERAYARRAQREGRAVGEPVRRGPRPKAERGTASRASFVMLVMGLLVAGVITTLWLSTQAIADSYRLDQAKKAATELAERSEVLEREVAGLQAASTLADMAAKLGMVPAGDPARLIVGPDGKVTVVGDPKPVLTTPAPPPTPTDPPTPEQPAIPPQQGAG